MAAIAVAIAGCGGGNDSGSGDGNANANANANGGGGGGGGTSGTTTLTGVVASGAPFSGAKLTAVDKTGATVCDTTVSVTGTYACELSATTAPPLVITALRDDVGLYSVTASAASGTVNVTPITTIIASRLAPNGNPAQLAAAIKADPAVVDATKIQSQITQVQALLKPVLDALGDTVNPITGNFKADGTGHDRVLDTIAVTVRPDGKAANIEVTVRTIPTSNEAAPVATSFRSSDPNPPALPAVATSALAPTDTSSAIADLMARLTACYALPLSQRVNVADNTAAVIGTAADVKAPACRSVFFNDDPATYMNGGSKVGRNGSNAGSFSSLFRPGATGVVFDQGEVGNYQSNGDVFVVFRTSDSAGNVTNTFSVARRSGKSLKLIGNQSAYSAFVFPAVQERDFINAPAFNYYNVGYDINIDNVTVNGASIFTKVLVTAPDGSTHTLVPTAGGSGLRIQRPNGTVTGSAILRLNAAYRNTTTAGHPADRETNLPYVSPRLTDAQIGALPNEGVWKIEFFHLDPAKPNVVQTHRTLQRAYTLAEASQAKFATLTSTMRAFLVNLTGQNKSVVFGPPSATAPNVVAFGTASVNAWLVPPLAVAPTSFTVFGNAPSVNGVAGAAFDDGVDFASSARTANVNCSKATNADTHCDTGTGVTQYAQNSSFNYVQLHGRNAKLVLFFEGIAFYVP